jgi:hypothetical protein
MGCRFATGLQAPCYLPHSLRSVCGSAVGADPPCMATHVRAYFLLATPQGPNSVLCPRSSCVSHSVLCPRSSCVSLSLFLTLMYVVMCARRRWGCPAGRVLRSPETSTADGTYELGGGGGHMSEQHGRSGRTVGRPGPPAAGRSIWGVLVHAGCSHAQSGLLRTVDTSIAL